jgi:hypothetical protein
MYKEEKFISYHSRGYKSKIKVSVGLVSVKAYIFSQDGSLKTTSSGRKKHYVCTWQKNRRAKRTKGAEFSFFCNGTKPIGMRIMK